MKADLHIHSNASQDAHVDPIQIMKTMKSRGFDALAILDHNSIRGSAAASKRAKEIGILLIRGLEVSSEAGHIGALAVEEDIPKGLSPEETVDRIHAAGGVAIALHPYRINTGIGPDVVRRCRFDALETVNGWTSERKNRKALTLADSLKLPYTAGSDGHREEEMGKAYLEIDNCSDQDEFLRLLLAGKGVPRGSGLSVAGSMRGTGELLVEWVGRGFRRL